MSKELVKRDDLERRIERWLKGGSPVLPPPVTTPAHYAPRETKAAIIWAPPDNLPPLSADAEVIELPRICARERKLWTTLHRRGSGEKYFEYLRSNVAESWRLSRYATPDRWGTLPSNLRLGVELCPHCGAYTRDGAVGSIYCSTDGGGCGMYCCYGLTSPNGYGICACGREGQLVNGTFPKAGFK